MQKRTQLLVFLIAVAALLLAVSIGVLTAPSRRIAPKLPGVQIVPMKRPSGAAYHPGRGTVLVVGQQGEIGEFELSGHCRDIAAPVMERHDLDIQGVTVDPLTGWIYVVDREAYLIYEIDIDQTPARVRRTFEVRKDDVPLLKDGRRRGKGLSGICALPAEGSQTGGRFILTHQDDPPGLIEVDLPLREPAPADSDERVLARFVGWYDFGTPDLSGVAYDAGTRSLIVLSARRAELLRVSLDGTILAARKFPQRVGMNGLALLPDRNVFIALAEGALQLLPPEQWGDPLPSSARVAAARLAEPVGEAEPPTPYYKSFDEKSSIKDDVFPYWHTRSGWRKYRPNGWVLFGFGGQFLFMMRFVVQWFVSERRKRVTVPVAFWYISIAGSLTILVYAVHREDIVFIAGQGLACAIYVRNLMLIYRRRRDVHAKRDGRRAEMVDDGTLQDGLDPEMPTD